VRTRDRTYSRDIAGSSRRSIRSRLQPQARGAEPSDRATEACQPGTLSQYLLPIKRWRGGDIRCLSYFLPCAGRFTFCIPPLLFPSLCGCMGCAASAWAGSAVLRCGRYFVRRTLHYFSAYAVRNRTSAHSTSTAAAFCCAWRAWRGCCELSSGERAGAPGDGTISWAFETL